MRDEDLPRWWRPAGATLLCLWGAALLCLPIRNADLYWHIHFGEWILNHRAVPRTEFLSATLNGSPWVDFEWLTQVLLSLLHSAAGCLGFMVFRAAWILAAAWITDRTLLLHGVSRAWRLLSALALLAAVLPLADVRADNISLFFFAATVHWLERLRLGREKGSHHAIIPFALLFAVWSNMHLGVCYGLLLIALYAVATASLPIASALLAASAATLLNPYGWRLYSVVWEHARAMPQLQAASPEWMAAGVRNYLLWPFELLLLACAFVLIAHYRRTKKTPPALVLACACFGAAALLHQRLLPYFCAFALPALAALLPEAFPLAQKTRRTLCIGLLGALWAHFLVDAAPLTAPVNGRPLCALPGAGAARFLAQEAATLGAKRLEHPTDYGGYWESVLPAPYRVFTDGRYIFEDLLLEQNASKRSPESWQAFLSKHGIEVACLPRRAGMGVSMLVPGPNGQRTELARPYYAAFMPEREWALVYWDAGDVLFARRGAVDAAWLRDHEYRAFRPDDDGFVEYLLGRKLLRPEDIQREQLRHGLAPGLLPLGLNSDAR